MALSASVAVLGTGAMGSAMARRLQHGGLDVIAWDRTAGRTAPLRDVGIECAASARAAAADSDFVLTMLTDGAAVESVMMGPVGALAAMRDQAVWLQMSTVGPAAAAALGAAAAARGVTFVDAPVSGSVQPAEEGRLVVLASGPDEARERCRVVFDVLGSRTLWLGPAGNGSRLKLVVNGWLAALVAALADGIRLSEAFGLDPRSFVDLLSGPLGPPIAAPKAQLMLDGSFPSSFALRLARKDLRLLLEAAALTGVDPGLVPAIEARYALADDGGHGDEDMAAVATARGPVAGDAAVARR